MKSPLFYIFFFLFSFPIINAQNPIPELGPVFKDDVVPKINIIIPQDSLDIMLAPGNEESNYHWHATFIFDNGDIVDTVENIGLRLRGNTSRYSAKKSFKISFNTYEPGRKWYGLEKLNINGEHNDPSISRSKIGWDILREMEIPAPRCNHVELYANGDYVGLFANVEHIDEEFVRLRFGNNDGNLYKCLFPADLNYKGADPDLYKEVIFGRRAYDLKTNEDIDDYSDLAHFIDVLNNTSIEDLACELEKVFNVNDYLKAIVFDILTGNWDGPIFNKNNFYLYKNEVTGKFEYIPYDIDNTIGIDFFGEDWANRDIYNWDSPNEYRPIYERLMEVPEYRNRFSFFMEKYLEETYNENLFSYLDNMRDLIQPSVEGDILYPLDYGFSLEDFENSFDIGLPFFQTPIGIKEFISDRNESALNQLENYTIPPIINSIENNYPNESNDLIITAKIEDDESVSSVEVCYQVDGGSETCSPMLDDGTQSDGMAGDGIYGIILPALGTPGIVEYYIKSTDNNSEENRSPVCESIPVYIGSSTVALVVNEFMASNSTVYADEFGEFDDWVEIFSMSDVPVFLGNYFLSDNEAIPNKWKMPDIWIQPEEYLIFWTDNDNGQGDFHTNFKLSTSGEFIGIFDSEANNFALIDGYEFDEQTTDISFGRIPNGTGNFQQVNATPGAFNEPYTATKEKIEELISINISPNPFSNLLQINFKKGISKNMEIEISDVTGRVILKNKIELNQTNYLFNTSSFSSGIYFLKIINKDGILISEKIIKG